jgi:hypothetical protein
MAWSPLLFLALALAPPSYGFYPVLHQGHLLRVSSEEKAWFTEDLAATGQHWRRGATMHSHKLWLFLSDFASPRLCVPTDSKFSRLVHSMSFHYLMSYLFSL